MLKIISKKNHTIPKYDLKDFRIVEDLQSGSFGLVQKAVYVPKNTIMVLKKISKKYILLRNQYTHIESEFKLSPQLKHPGIVETYGMA